MALFKHLKAYLTNRPATPHGCPFKATPAVSCACSCTIPAVNKPLNPAIAEFATHDGWIPALSPLPTLPSGLDAANKG